MSNTIDLTLVIPTKGRPSLDKALESVRLANQGGYAIDVVVAYDLHGPTPDGYLSRDEVKSLVSQHAVRFIPYNAGYNDWGYPQLDYIYKTGVCEDFIMNIGDDDVMVEGVIPKIMEVIWRHGIQPYLFQAELHPSSHRGNEEPVILWNDSDRSIERGKVTGQNLILPNIPHLFGKMTDDFEFIRSTIERWHNLVKWVPIVTCRCY